MTIFQNTIPAFALVELYKATRNNDTNWKKKKNQKKNQKKIHNSTKEKLDPHHGYIHELVALLSDRQPGVGEICSCVWVINAHWSW